MTSRLIHIALNVFRLSCVVLAVVVLTVALYPLSASALATKTAGSLDEIMRMSSQEA